jgi:hypothetical protein
MSRTEERLALAEAKIVELQTDLYEERQRSVQMRQQLEAAAHDAASLESRLRGAIAKLEASYHSRRTGE